MYPCSDSMSLACRSETPDSLSLKYMELLFDTERESSASAPRRLALENQIEKIDYFFQKIIEN
ncbi:hypothetical protein DPMN_188696 [Dreissena polymorpha]|uniref:Uncharacterized protein n=1 Tax=Dreissena polymorpha TaxID=45954 RepID=A0A9D4DS36_DREPO|nr:hypothetical protein DPMN_188696 [Dreissena polymorpha]